MRRFILIALTSVFLAGGALAGPVEDSITRQLLDQGFDEIRISRTLLGRSRIVATSDSLRREIVVNPNTGEILRDYIRKSRGEGGFDSIFNPNSGGGSQGTTSGRGGDKNDDREDDDRDDDDDDRDDDSANSGKGSDNSGRGGENSGRGGGDDRDDGDGDDDDD